MLRLIISASILVTVYTLSILPINIEVNLNSPFKTLFRMPGTISRTLFLVKNTKEVDFIFYCASLENISYRKFASFSNVKEISFKNALNSSGVEFSLPDPNNPSEIVTASFKGGEHILYCLPNISLFNITISRTTDEDIRCLLTDQITNDMGYLKAVNCMSKKVQELIGKASEQK